MGARASTDGAYVAATDKTQAGMIEIVTVEIIDDHSKCAGTDEWVN